MNHFFVAPGSIIKNGKYSTVRWWMTKSIHRPVDTSLMCQLEMFQKNPRPIHSPLFVIKNSTFAIVLNKMFLTTFFLPVIVRRDNPRFTKVLVPVGRGHPERKWRDTTRAFLCMRRRRKHYDSFWRGKLWTGRSFWFCFLKEGWRIHTPYSKHVPPCSIPPSLSITKINVNVKS